MTSSATIRLAVRPPGAPRPAILLVDDKPANLLALEAILDPFDLDLVRAGSGEEALKHLLRRDFALVLLDVQMPGMDGFETATAIRGHSRTAELPIIFITAISRETQNIFTGYARGAVDYLLKPFDPEILRAKVRVFVDLYTKNETIRMQAALLHAREVEAVERRGANRLQLLTESMPLAMWALRKTGEAFYVNAFWKEYSGLDAAQTAGVDNPAHTHPEDTEGVHAAWMDAFVGKVPFEREYRLRRAADATYRWHLVRAIPERRDGGAIEGWIVTAVDVHEQKMSQQAQARLLEKEHNARVDAESANRMKDEFLANVSHELRTPLNAILGWTRMLRSGMLSPERNAHALETVERSARMQTELIEDLLDVSRIISGKLRLKTVVFDLPAIVRAAIDTVRPAAELKGLVLECEVADGVGPMSGDPARIQQVVWNLVSNAVKFTDKDGLIGVKVTPRGSDVAIIVTDSGAGISGDFLPYVFDRFRQADYSSTRSHQGLGLGLAIVRHLVELHGGRVRAESAGLGQGAVFTVTLPSRVLAASEPEPTWGTEKLTGPRELPNANANANASAPAASAAPARAKRLEGLRVVFVDDQDDARELFSEFLSDAGAKVIAAENAAEALAAVDELRPHVLVSDIGLPDQDGYALIRQVRIRHPDLPAIAVSGYGRTEDRQRALAEGFQLHLTKPVELDEVLTLIVSLAEAREA